MPRKPLAETESDTDRRNRPEVADQQLAGAVRDSTHQIWLAGLGAFAKAQQEGTKVFEALVKEGSELQRRTLAASGDRRVRYDDVERARTVFEWGPAPKPGSQKAGPGKQSSGKPAASKQGSSKKAVNA